MIRVLTKIKETQSSQEHRTQSTQDAQGGLSLAETPSALLHQEIVIGHWLVSSTALSISFPTTYNYIKNKIKNLSFIPVQNKEKKSLNKHIFPLK